MAAKPPDKERRIEMKNINELWNSWNSEEKSFAERFKNDRLSKQYGWTLRGILHHINYFGLQSAKQAYEFYKSVN